MKVSLRDKWLNWIEDAAERLVAALARHVERGRIRRQQREQKDWARRLRRRGAWFPGDEV